ncbi:MAG: class I SAM-dependent methyltransferase [Crenarchaeota archaeon]|nr:class I SAM-dependent methyltransferase [Thermoproteota archaeon]MDW8034650.1 class I SAM-dependent methyltransferase [Nitrososphaerota archaeon]
MQDKNSIEISFEEYLNQLKLNQLFEKLGISDSELLAKEVEYFTREEAEKRDRIVVNYFGKEGVNRIVNKIIELLFAPPELPPDASLLDVGAGTGFFTVKIAEKVKAMLPEARFYAMDITPAMLLSLFKKNTDVKPFVGVAEKIEESVKEARAHIDIPLKFDVVFSILMLHHIAQPEKVFESIKKVLKRDGKAIVIDLCEHSFEEFREEMGDIHLGFNPEEVYKMVRKTFSNVEVNVMPGIRCECSRRSAELFVAYMQNNP